MTEQEIIKISKNLPVNKFEPAMNIAMEFHKDRLVYVPLDSVFSLGFFQMVAAIWTSGYVAGVQEERKKRRR